MPIIFTLPIKLILQYILIYFYQFTTGVNQVTSGLTDDVAKRKNFNFDDSEQNFEDVVNCQIKYFKFYCCSYEFNFLKLIDPIDVEDKATEKKRIEAITALGDAELEAGNLIAALICYSELIGRHENNYDAFSKRCQCLQDLKQYKLAIKDAKRAIELDGSKLTHFYDLSECYLKLGDLESAEAALGNYKPVLNMHNFAEKLRINIDKARKMENDVEHFMRTNQIDRCLQTIQSAIALSPDNLSHHLNKARCKIVKQQFFEADEILCQFNSLKPRVSLALKSYYSGKLIESFNHFDFISKSADPMKNIKSLVSLHATVTASCAEISRGKIRTSY